MHVNLDFYIILIEANICMARPSKSKMEEKCGVLFKTVKSERYIKGF